jgi:hypothetical protein
MKHIQIFENKVSELGSILQKTDFKSPDVEDFIFSLDPKEINLFKKSFMGEGILSKKRFNLLTKYFKNFLDIEFLDQVISSTEKSFKDIEYFIEYPDQIKDQNKDHEAQIRMLTDIISNKEMIFKRLKSLKTRIEKYQQEF